MRPIFTVHAGEYLVACEIESRLQDCRVWVPSKDDGIDLLVTDRECKKRASIQVKFSKDHLAVGKDPHASSAIKSGGWWKFDREGLEASTADYWVLVLCDIGGRKYDYVVVRPKELANRYQKIAPNSQTIQSYFWVTHSGDCWETRGLGKGDKVAISQGKFRHPDRNFREFLNEWPF